MSEIKTRMHGYNLNELDEGKDPVRECAKNCFLASEGYEEFEIIDSVFEKQTYRLTVLRPGSRKPLIFSYPLYSDVENRIVNARSVAAILELSRIVDHDAVTLLDASEFLGLNVMANVLVKKVEKRQLMFDEYGEPVRDARGKPRYTVEEKTVVGADHFIAVDERSDE